MKQPDTSKWDRYSGNRWSSLRTKAQETQQEYKSGEHSETVKHQLADRLREILGGVTVAGELIPRIMAEHKKAMEWGLERLLVSAKRLENLPYSGLGRLCSTSPLTGIRGGGVLMRHLEQDSAATC